MNAMPKWMGIANPKAWARKADVPDLATARRIDFGLHGFAWCRFRGSEVVMASGEWMPTHEARLHCGHVIGPRDLTAADRFAVTHPEMPGQWRGSLNERIMAELKT